MRGGERGYGVCCGINDLFSGFPTAAAGGQLFDHFDRLEFLGLQEAELGGIENGGVFGQRVIEVYARCRSAFQVEDLREDRRVVLREALALWPLSARRALDSCVPATWLLGSTEQRTACICNSGQTVQVNWPATDDG